jgi:hypothetical protein
MAKDSYWFKHDSTAGRGLKMRKMAHIYGHWGKGIYWDVIEILRDQNDYKFESDDSSLQLLADLIGCKDDKKFLSWFIDCERLGLFKIVENNFYCEPLSKNMQVWETKKANGSKGGRGNKSESESESKANVQANQKHKIREDKIREDNIIELYDFFVDEVKQGLHRQATESIYMRLKIKPGSLTQLLKDFKGQLIIDQTLHPNTLELRKHFNNWLNKLDQNGKLAQYKKIKTL